MEFKDNSPLPDCLAISIYKVLYYWQTQNVEFSSIIYILKKHSPINSN